MAEENMDLTIMLKDVQQVLHSHLSNILNPILLEKKTINEVLLNMPYVKKLHEQNQELHRKLVSLQSEYNADKIRKDEIIKELSKKLEQLGSGTIKLEVKELNCTTCSPAEIVVLDNTDNKHKNCKVKIASQDNLDYFSNLVNSSDEEDEDEDEDDDEDEDSETPSDSEMFKMNDNQYISAKTGKTYQKNDAGGFKLFEKSYNEDSIACNVAGPKGDDGPVSNNVEELLENLANEEDEEDEDEDEDEDEEEDEDGMEVEEIVIDNETYLTDNQTNGTIYKCDGEGEILEDGEGDWVQAGYFKDGISFFI